MAVKDSTGCRLYRERVHETAAAAAMKDAVMVDLPGA
jgi:hypothetical protein